MSGIRACQHWRSAVLPTPGLRRVRAGSAQRVLQPLHTQAAAAQCRLLSASRRGASVAASAFVGAPPADPSAIRSLHTWEDLTMALNNGVTGHQSNYAAVRKLSELARKNSPQYRALTDDGKDLLTNGIDNMLRGVSDDVKLLGIHEQQILLLELSQLSAIFTGPDWRQHCPDVPVELLNKLLDSIISGVRSLKGSQVGMVLFSLHKLQLRDPRAYSHVCEAIIDQLDSPGRNSWFKNTDALSKIISGAIMVSIVRSLSLSLSEAFESLCMYVDQPMLQLSLLPRSSQSMLVQSSLPSTAAIACVQSVPRNIREDYLDAIITSTLDMLAALDEDQFTASQTPWADVCMAVEAVARLQPSHGHVYAPYITPLLDSFVAAAPEVPAYSLAQAVNAAALPGVQHVATVRLVSKRVLPLIAADMPLEVIALLVDTVKAQSRMPGPPDAQAINAVLQSALEKRVPSVVLAQLCVHAQRAGCLTPEAWSAALAGEPWASGPGASADTPDSEVGPWDVKALTGGFMRGLRAVSYTKAIDVECEAILSVAIARRNAAVTAQAAFMALDWVKKEKLFLWRMVPYMEVLSNISESSGVLLSDSPEPGMYPLELHNLVLDTFVSMSGSTVKLANPNVFVHNRALEMCHAIAACVKTGRTGDANSMIVDPMHETFFADMGGREGAMMHVLSILADDHFTETSFEPRQSKTEAVLAVWQHALGDFEKIPPHVGHRFTVCAALTLCRYQVPPAQWVPQVAHALDAKPPTTHKEMLQAVVQSRWFATQASDDEKIALERFLPTPAPDRAGGQQAVSAAAPAAISAELPASDDDLINDEGLTEADLEDEVELIEPAGSPPAPAASASVPALAAAAAAAAEPEAAAVDYSAMTLPELKDELRQRGLRVSGKKAELVARIAEFDADNGAATASASASEDDAAMMEPAMIEPETSASEDDELEAALEDLPPSIASDLAKEIRSDELSGSEREDVLIEDAVGDLDGDLSAGEAAEPELDAAGAEDMFATMKVPELKELLKQNGLKVSGKKSELVERLIENGVAAPVIA